MLKALRNPTARDNRALAVFFGISLLSAIYFASGILVSYVSPPSDFVEMARDGKGFLIEVTNLPGYDAALQMSQQLRLRQIESTIDFAPTNNGYVLRIGPLARRSMAERMAGELRQNGYDQISLRESCPDGSDCTSEARPEATSDNPLPAGGPGSNIAIEPGGPTGPTGRTTDFGQSGRSGETRGTKP